jgi:hypothetical protein
LPLSWARREKPTAPETWTTDSGLAIRLVGRNLIDENRYTFVFPTPFLPAGNANAQSEQPRTVVISILNAPCSGVSQSAIARALDEAKVCQLVAQSLAG